MCNLTVSLGRKQEFLGSGDKGVDIMGAIFLLTSLRLLSFELSTVTTPICCVGVFSQQLSEGGAVITSTVQEAEAWRCEVTCQRPHRGELPSWDLCPRPPTCLSSPRHGHHGGLSPTIGCLFFWRLTAPSCFTQETSWDSSRFPDTTYLGDSTSLSHWGPPP